KLLIARLLRICVCGLALDEVFGSIDTETVNTERRPLSEKSFDLLHDRFIPRSPFKIPKLKVRHDAEERGINLLRPVVGAVKLGPVKPHRSAVGFPVFPWLVPKRVGSRVARILDKIEVVTILVVRIVWVMGHVPRQAALLATAHEPI